ncbi:MAG: hypothetical protein CVU71_16100 [Deltaproteobacteria bacterium HGW-Deltaproteobacteria-6]|nr:MAG: hypothetical protein CVU71_16100 [Deltaproteobacteria bacterium HGW-Deltaproteobacteria-6]
MNITIFLSMPLPYVNGGASAFNDADLTRLKITGSLDGCNLSGANLVRANLSGATWTDGLKCKAVSTGRCNK